MQASSGDTTFAARGQDEEMIYVYRPGSRLHWTAVHTARRSQAHMSVSLLGAQREDTRIHSLSRILKGWCSSVPVYHICNLLTLPACCRQRWSARLRHLAVSESYPGCQDDHQIALSLIHQHIVVVGRRDSRFHTVQNAVHRSILIVLWHSWTRYIEILLFYLLYLSGLHKKGITHTRCEIHPVL